MALTVLETCAATFILLASQGRPVTFGLAQGNAHQRHDRLGNSIEARSVIRNVCLGSDFGIWSFKLYLA
jgi:hypothetical protein